MRALWRSRRLRDDMRMEQRISLITLGVANLRRAMDFYAAMGWQGSSPDDDVAFFQAGGMVFALWDRAKLAADSGVADSGGWGGVTLAYNARSPADVDAVIDEVAARGRNSRAPGCRDVLGRLLGRVLRSRTGIPGRSRTIRAGRSPRTAA